MDEQFAIDVMSGRKRGLTAAGLRSACTLASWGYAAAVQLRNLAYDSRWLPSLSVDVPVISLGNLTAGGTGKTPLAAYLAEELQRRGFHPGIVSRGYRSLNDQANDERLVLEQLLPGVPQVQQRDRVAGAKSIIESHGCDVILLDDGFQHRRLQRDLDIVLIDATRPWGFGRLLPRGLLREPLSSLQRADLVLLTRCDQISPSERAEIDRQLMYWRGTADCIEIRFTPCRLRNSAGGIRPLTWLQTRRSLAFCGIGNPDGFRRTLAGLQVNAAPLVFPDHHHYGEDDLHRIAAAAQVQGAEVILTTQKDLVKIPFTELDGRPLWAVEIAAQILSGSAAWDEALAGLRHISRHAA